MGKYTTWGPCRGMGPIRKTRQAAEQDAERDGAGCNQQGGYSDRYVYAIDADGFLRDEDGRIPMDNGYAIKAY